jgi:hypothetical protein
MCKANPKVVLKQLGDFLDALFYSPPAPHTQTKYHKVDKRMFTTIILIIKESLAIN